MMYECNCLLALMIHEYIALQVNTYTHLQHHDTNILTLTVTHTDRHTLTQWHTYTPTNTDPETHILHKKTQMHADRHRQTQAVTHRCNFKNVYIKRETIAQMIRNRVVADSLNWQIPVWLRESLPAYIRHIYESNKGRGPVQEIEMWSLHWMVFTPSSWFKWLDEFVMLLHRWSTPTVKQIIQNVRK